MLTEPEHFPWSAMNRNTWKSNRFLKRGHSNSRVKSHRTKWDGLGWWHTVGKTNRFIPVLARLHYVCFNTLKYCFTLSFNFPINLAQIAQTYQLFFLKDN